MDAGVSKSNMTADKRNSTLTFAVDERARRRSPRLDLFLAARLPERSRAALQRLILGGHVTVNGAAARPGSRVRPGDRVEVELPPVRPMEVLPEPIPLEILFEDDQLVVVNKPAGMNVHPVPNCVSSTLVNALLHHCRNLSGIGGVARPGIVHRLDRETSGAIVVAKTDAAHLSLTAQFRDRTVKKQYAAVVHGKVERKKTKVEASIGRNPHNRKKMAVLKRGGREAITEFEVVERLGGFTVLEARPLTGRTHQIRVHASHIGHPVAGDALYGGRRARVSKLPDDVRDEIGAALEGLEGHALHARRLEFRHPKTGETIACEAPLRDDVECFIKEMRKLKAVASSEEKKQ